jgi:uncharacterized protein YndB with AHSA1/START domain
VTDKLEKTFELAVPVERAWQVFTDPRELSAWAAGDGYKEFDARPGGRYVLSVEGMPDLEGQVLEAEPHRRLVYTEPPGILPGETTVTVTFEATDSGTRVTVTQSGFGDGDDWLGHLESYGTGWDEALYDLHLYLRTGVAGKRFFTWQSTFGLFVRDTPAGAEVLKVQPGTLAERLGLRPGDLLLKVGNASIFSERDLGLLSREHPPGTEVELTYVRGGEVRSGAGALTPMF